ISRCGRPLSRANRKARLGILPGGAGASLGIGLVAPLVGTWSGYRGALALSAGIAGAALLCACVLKMRTDS
ncbi:hypothetical protein R6H00_08510, partial [Actinotignum timonense]|nr:hypothetical protein [Actinotignum timonense]